MRHFLWMTTLAGSLFLAACGDETSPSPASSSSTSSSSTVDCTKMPAGVDIELVSPVGGETYKVGETMKITWRFNADNFSGILPQISPDNGNSWKELSTASVELGAKGVKCATYEWKVDTTALAGKSSNDQVLIRVRDYNDNTLRSTSKTLTVQQ